MGIIQRQSLKFTAINFLVTFIGFLSVIFIYPLDQKLYGLFQVVFSYAALLVPILTLGIHGGIVKYFPIFTLKGREKNFLSFTLLMTTGIVLITTPIAIGIYYLFRSKMFEIFDNFKDIDDNKVYILILSYLLMYGSVFLYHAVARFRIVVPEIINTSLLKIFLPFAILMTYWGIWNRGNFLIIILVYFAFVLIALIWYLLSISKQSLNPQVETLDRKEYRQFFAFITFAMLNGLGASLALRLDNIMIGSMLSLEAVAVYAIINTISNVMEIPAKAINQIASPVISSNWANKNHANIQDVYQKSSVFGLGGGIFLFLILFFIWPELLTLMGSSFHAELPTVLWIFTLLSLAKIIDLMTGVNSVIIIYSNYYRYHMYFLLVLAAVNVILNYYLLMKIGIIGAALATAISFITFNLLKNYFVKRRFGYFIDFSPHLKIVISGLICFGMMYFVSLPWHPIISIIIKCTLTTTIFGGLMYYFNPGGEIRQIVHNYWQQGRSKFPF
ncbi:MAG: polysaccharide biosynthesis C-terminal domain-containing protein [Saprospiraceae bacterium]